MKDERESKIIFDKTQQVTTSSILFLNKKKKQKGHISEYYKKVEALWITQLLLCL